MNRTFDARLRALEALEETQQAVPAYVLLVPGDCEGEWIAPDGTVVREMPGGRLVEIGDAPEFIRPYHDLWYT
jgi:hypothetical protein